MKYAIVGGGVAGVCCAEELCRLCPDDQIILISADRTLKVEVGRGMRVFVLHCDTRGINVS